MKNYTIFVLIFSLSFITLINPLELHAGDNPENNIPLKEKSYIKDIEKLKSKKSSVFSLDLDILLGVSIANTKFDIKTLDSTTQNLNNNSTKVGPDAGVVLSVNFFGFGFTTGLLYASKGFKTASGDNANLNFFNIPLLFNFDITFSKVIINGNLGPYFGLLLSSSNDNSPAPPYKIKSFDFGLTGALQGAYMITKHLGPILGLKYEYGGINNLGNNDKINGITTQTFFIYTGVKFLL